MTKKRKINYAELLKADATGPVPEPTPMPQPLPAPGPSPLPSPTPAPEPVPVPDEPPVPSGPAPDVGAERSPEPQPAVPKPAESQPSSKPPARSTTRRRRADNAESPRELASAHNERARFEREQRGEAQVAAEPSSPPAAAAGGPPRDHDAAAAPAEHHRASAHGAGSAPAHAPAAGVEPAARPSSALAAIGGDTMEFAVANAVQALPFRERAKARLGRAELLLFSVGRELFATPLSAVEEAIELAEIRPIPEMSASMLGVTELRGRMIPIYSPSRSLGVDLGAAPAAALIVHTGERRIALAVDDVEDVLELDLTELRDAPGTDDLDGVLVGVARRGKALVAVVDGESLVVACLTDQVPETA